MISTFKTSSTSKVYYVNLAVNLMEGYQFVIGHGSVNFRGFMSTKNTVYSEYIQDHLKVFALHFI